MGGAPPQREVDQLVWFEASRRAHLGSVDPLKADKLRTGIAVQQCVLFRTAALEGRGLRVVIIGRWGLACCFSAISLRQRLPRPRGNLVETFTLVLRLLSIPALLLCLILTSFF